MPDDTTAELEPIAESAASPLAALVLTMVGRRAHFEVFPVQQGEVLIGRGEQARVRLDDATLSRAHAEVHLARDGWVVRDMSRNGTFVDGQRVSGELRVTAARTLRLGDSVFLFSRDARPLMGQKVLEDGEHVIGPTLRRAHAQIAAVARDGLDLLLLGESGAGKERAARVFHSEGPAPKGPMLSVNCATISANLFESELFGHVRGAFSGADRDRIGLFEAASGGTLFLDEVGEIPLEMQAKLLRVLQERTVRRVGDTRDRPVDVRVIAATNKTVSGLAAPEWLRADLFYRLARAVVRLPSLRERAEDITTMLERELARVSPRRQMSGAFAERCLRHDWPGNARELAAVLRYAERLARDADAARSAAVLLDEQFLPPLQPRTEHAVAEEATPGEITPEVLKAALRAADGNVSAAATKLGVHRNTVHRYMKRFGIDDE